MKANAILKEQEALDYMKKYTMSPYAAKSAKLAKRQLVRPSTASSSSSKQFQLPQPHSTLMMSYDQTRPASSRGTSSKPTAAEQHAIKLWKLMEKEEYENNMARHQQQQQGRESAPGSPKNASQPRAASPISFPTNTTTISSPLSAKLMANLRDMGVSGDTASLLGAAVGAQSLLPRSTTDTASHFTSTTTDRPTTPNQQRPFSSTPTSASTRRRPPASASSTSTSPAATHSNTTTTDPTAAWPKTEAFVNHWGVHSRHRPTGAHSSGHYAKQYHENFVASSGLHVRNVPITASAVDPVVDHEEEGGDVVHAGRMSRGPPQARMSTGGGVVKGEKEEFERVKRKSRYVNETEVTDEQLCLLTDPECTPEEVLGALSILIALAFENDNHALTESLHQLQHDHPTTTPSSTTPYSLQQHQQLRAASKRNHKQDSSSTNLAASTTSMTKSIMDSNTSVSSDGDVINGSTSTMNERLVQAPKLAQTKRASLQPPMDPSSTNSIQDSSSVHYNSLVTGILQKYYDPRFLVQLDKMDKTARSEIVKHLLCLFQKVDKLVLMGSLISLEMDTEVALYQIVEEAESLVDCQMVLLYTVDPSSGDLVAADFDPWLDVQEKELIRSVKYPIGVGIAGWVSETHEAVNISKDASRHDRFENDVDVRGMNVIANTVLSVPLMSKEGILKGVLQAINKMGTNGNVIPFHQEDEFLLKTLASLAGTLISNAQIFDRLRRTQEKVEVLLETTRSLGSTLELDLLVKRIMEAAKDLLTADRCTLFLSDVKAKQLKAHIQGKTSIEEIRIPMNSGIAGFAFTSGESVNIPDAYQDSRFNPDVDKKTGYKTRNMLCIPIRNIGGINIGVTQMINKKVGAFEADDEKLLISFSAQAAVAIENSNLFKKTQDMLRETQNMKNYLNSIIQSITNVVITLDKNGYLSHINHPSKMDISPQDVATLTTWHYVDWLGEENDSLIGDIERSLAGQEECSIIAQDYELHVKGKIKNVNYTIVQMQVGEIEGGVGSAGSVVKGRQGSVLRTGREGNGVVIVLEDISSEKRALMTLGRYMSPALAKQVMAEGGSQLGGLRKKVSILFSDIRSFTEISESMEPQLVVEMLNHHFTDAVNAILSEQGILDKYIGDAVMAVFGVPFVNPEDAIHACNAALRMNESIGVYNEQVRIPKGEKPIKMGIGINSGMVLSGNIGSLKRMEFSCIGDAVNLSSRVEGMTKAYGVSILITENTVEEVGDHFLLREVDSVIVKGKSKAVTIYELLGRKGDVLDDNMVKALEFFAMGLKMYRQRFFEQAVECFSLALKEKADDGPSQVMLDRSIAFQHDLPGEDWTGVHFADSK
ncbi:hypothetical protein HDU98_002771 [Podochytrium sp. JEL0797]|nr:hypothetical protein HDU98_002771 [Podochytrium sp. JEL0797]